MSLVKNSMPQSVRWMTRERMVSSLARPLALRIVRTTKHGRTGCAKEGRVSTERVLRFGRADYRSKVTAAKRAECTTDRPTVHTKGLCE
jgi:hypothetical protein